MPAICKGPKPIVHQTQKGPEVGIVWTALNVPVICDLTHLGCWTKVLTAMSLTETPGEVSAPAFPGRYQMKHSCSNPTVAVGGVHFGR